MKYITLIVLAFTLSGCISYSQIFHTSSPKLASENGTPVFENDTIRIQYYFWANKGILAFNIYNKLDKPIYIDWKRSSFIKNSQKLDYWADETSVETASYSANVYGYAINWNNNLASVGTAISYGKAIKPERITFIAPHSAYSRNAPFYLYNSETELALPESAPSEQWPTIYSNLKTIKVRYTNFSKEKTPLSFRNYLTVSTTERFEGEFSFDNEFFVSRITELPSSQMHGPSIEGTNDWTDPYKQGDRFYIILSSGSFKKF